MSPCVLDQSLRGWGSSINVSSFYEIIRIPTDASNSEGLPDNGKEEVEDVQGRAPLEETPKPRKALSSTVHRVDICNKNYGSLVASMFAIYM